MGGQTVWTQDLLKKMDKVNDLKGVFRLIEFFGCLLMEDHVHSKCHCKPVFKHALVSLFMDYKLMVVIKKTGEVSKTEVYEFADQAQGVWMRIRHVRTGVSAPIPDDIIVKAGSHWRIESNHNWKKAEVVGKKTGYNILEMFEESEIPSAWAEYDQDEYLNDKITTACKATDYNAEKTVMQSFLAEEEKDEQAHLAPPTVKPAGPSISDVFEL